MSTGTTSPRQAASTAAAEVPLRELAPAELGAWRGLLRVHSALVKALDAELIATHGLPLTSYEVLINLQGRPAAGAGWPSWPTACCSAARARPASSTASSATACSSATPATPTAAAASPC